MSPRADSRIAAVVPESEPSDREELSSAENYVVKKGDTLSKIWKILGAPYAQSLKAADAFKRSGVPLGQIREGRSVRYSMSEGLVVFAEFELPAGRRLAMKWDGKNFSPVLAEAEMKKTKISAAGTISGSLAQSAHSHGIPFSVVDDMVDVLAGKIDFSKDLREGDSFSVVYESSYREEALLEASLVSASLYVNGRRQFAILHTGEDGKPATSMKMGPPWGLFF